MPEKAPRPAALGGANRAGDIEAFGDGFNPPDSSTGDPHQETPAAEARVETSAITAGGAEQGLACQHLIPRGKKGLDVALARLFPTIPEEGRRSLRQPLERWRRAAVRYLRSRRAHSDADDFIACWFGLLGGYGPKRQPFIGALLRALHGEIGRAINRRPCTCPWRETCALLEVVDWLFLGVKGGEVNRPVEDEKLGDV
jgi:hypothetical protein